jgi:Zn-dependent oligopeptidase
MQFSGGKAEALEPLVQDRLQLAQLQGSNSYLDLVVKNRILTQPTQIEAFLSQLSKLTPPTLEYDAQRADQGIELEAVLHT